MSDFNTNHRIAELQLELKKLEEKRDAFENMQDDQKLATLLMRSSRDVYADYTFEGNGSWDLPGHKRMLGIANRYLDVADYSSVVAVLKIAGKVYEDF